MMAMVMRTPLHELEAARGGRFREYHDWEIAEHYGDPRQEYEVVRGDVGILDLCHAGKLRVADRDRVRYLNNMLSNDIKNLSAGRGCYATLLTHQGRMESDLYVYAFTEELWLECLPASKPRLFETLSRYIVGDKVTVADWTEKLGILSLQGPHSRVAIERLTGLSLESLDLLEHRTLQRPSGNWVVVRRDRTGCGGYDLWAPVLEAPEIWRRCVETAQISPVGHAALNWLRTEAGIPWYGTDMGEKTLPMEAGLSHALSMTKGCYRGQEIVARVLHRGHLDRGIGAVSVQHADPPAAGAEIRANGNRIGEVSSSIFSQRLGKPLALAILRVEFLKPGTPVEVVYGDRNYPGEVIALPIQ